MASKSSKNGLHAADEQRFLFDCPETGTAANGKEATAVPRPNGRNLLTGHRRVPPSTSVESELASLKDLVGRLDSRLAGLETVLAALHDHSIAKKIVKEFYTTAEVAKILGKRPYTVREWCRLGRINAEKANFGRGLDEEWRVRHDELLRIQNEGLLSLKSFSAVGAPKRLGK